MAIDYGTKRTGLAVTDPLKIIASPLTTVETHTLVAYLEKYFFLEKVEKVIIGWPLQDNGELSSNASHVQDFIQLFKKKFPNMPIILQDEWGTSKAAVKSMVAGGVKKKDRRDKALVDKIAAVLILQAYMESQL